MDPVRILGAGLSGLTAAINLAKAGREVVVHEKRASAGLQIKPNYQGLLKTHGDPMGYLKKLNLEPKFDLKQLKKAYLCTRTRDIDVTLTESIDFLLRGGPNSLEIGLYDQAVSEGVKFEFETTVKPEEANIVATGFSGRVDMAAYTAVYEGCDYEQDRFLYMHDDRYSPRGWYLYVTPYFDGKIKVVNCTSQPHIKDTKKLLFKAIKEREILRKIVGDREPVLTFGGSGGVDIPKSAMRDGRYYVGEVAGFQDPWRGFGMNYALESGFLAAKALEHGKDYDQMWKARFHKYIKNDMYRRYAMVLFGDKAIEHAFRNYKDGMTVDINKANPSGIKGTLLRESFYRLELLHRKRTGYW